MKKREPSYIIHGNVNWYSHYGKQYGGSLKELKIELPYDPVIPRIYIPRYTHPEKTKTLIKKIHAPQCSQQHYLQ